MSNEKKKEESGIPLLLKWAGKDKGYLYLSLVLSLMSSILAVVPYFVFYKIIDAVTRSDCTYEFAIKCSIVMIISVVLRYLTFSEATIFSHKGAYHTLFKVRCMVTEHMSKMPLGNLSEFSTGAIKTL